MHSNEMDEDDERDDTKRKSRNLSEKKRRDQFNLLVNELSSMISSHSRKMDKSTVLKSTIAYLKHHNEIADRSRVHEIQENWKPKFLPNEEFTHLILEALDGFIIVFSSSGRVHYASESVQSLLGHLPNDLSQMTIYDMVYEEEHQSIYNILLSPPKTVIDPLQSGVSLENQVSFLCHVKRGSMEAPPKVSYEYVQFTGYFRDNVDEENIMPSNRYCGFPAEADTRTLFVGTGRLMTPQLIREMSFIDMKSEFTSRHSLEWKFLFLDHRAPPIIGYMPFEVLGTSGYDYYHFDDLERVVTCHEALMQKGEGTSCFYRFLTKGQQWIWLQTRFYITYHQWNSKPEFVVCTHRVVSYADVMRHMRKNNGTLIRNIEDTDSTNEDRKPAASYSNLMATSPMSAWSSKSSRVSMSQTNTQESSSIQMKRSQSYRPDSDSTLIDTADSSPLSHHSILTKTSSASKRSKSSQNVHKRTPSNHLQQPQSHFSQFSLPHSPATNSLIQQPQQPHMIPRVHPLAFQAPIATQIVPNIQRPPGPSQLVGTSFIDQAQYLAAIPMQPVFSSNATVISAIPPAVDYSNANVVLTPAQNQFQDHLQRKHEELQKLIVQQQDELRKVSEQLFMARYGMIPSIVNIPISHSAPMDQTDGGESVRSMGSSSHMTHSAYIDPQMMSLTQMPGHSQSNPQIIVQPPNQNQAGGHHLPQHLPVQYDLHKLKPEQMSETDQNDEILQYMQHQATVLQPHSQVIQQQNIGDDFELMPFQMMNQQAQILFSSGNAGENSSNSNK